MVQALWMTSNCKNFLVIVTDIKRHSVARECMIVLNRNITSKSHEKRTACQTHLFWPKLEDIVRDKQALKL